MTGDGPTIGPSETSPRRRLPSIPPLGKDAVRAVTLLHSFPGLRHETIARALGLSPMLAAETLGMLQRQGLVVFAPMYWGRPEIHLRGWAATGIWNPDDQPTADDTDPDWPEERGPLDLPVETR